ncbi:DNA fragmentation factor subunit alpha-like [Gastrophryne carolinensis]
MKRCVLSDRGGGQRHGVAAATIKELQEKAVKVLKLDPVAVTLVLAEDGTIVEDEDYFLCLPEDTRFVALQGDKTWKPCVDGGTAWVARESVDLDEVDDGEGPRWKVLAAQLRENLSNIILFSESDFQTLIDVATDELSKEMALSATKTEMLKDTLQGLLDRREEERQCKELLQLYLEAVKRDDVDGHRPPAPEQMDETDCKEKSEETQPPPQLSSRVLTILEEKKSPHLSLSNEQLEAVCAQEAGALSSDLKWSLEKIEELQAKCQEQLQLRYEQVQCMNSLSGLSQSKKKNLA